MPDAGLPHGDLFVTLALLAVPLVVVFFLASVVYLWFLQGARIIAAAWVWRRFFAWLRARSDHPGGAGGRGGHSREYVAFMQSPAWERQRARVLRRDRHRCRDCGRRATDVHHQWYASPLEDTPDYGLLSLCEGCHRQSHPA